MTASRFAAFDPATLYEASGRRGAVDPAIRPAWPGARICGVACTVECPPGDNLMMHYAVAAARPGMVIVAAMECYLLAGAWGEILTAAAQAKGVAGVAVDGAVRDTVSIAARGFPLFSRGIAIGACTKERRGKLDVPIQFGGVTVRPGDIIVGDADGLVVVDQDRAGEVLRAAEARQEREAEIMKALAQGKTTVELLGLPK
ncbi:MAG: RraA family protein [Acidobacteriia bacterium]|nr:RraA family protein [Terriglobia bacterium]